MPPEWKAIVDFYVKKDLENPRPEEKKSSQLTLQQQLTLIPSRSENPLEEAQWSSRNEAIAAFKELLEDLDVDYTWTWERT